MTSSRKRLKRFHRDIYFPDWGKQSLNYYLGEILHNGSLTFSLHALEKIVDYSFDYGKNLFKYLVKVVDRKNFDIENVFEFYSNGETVKKACFRYSFSDFPVDLIAVISSDGVVITVYVTNKGDNHTTFDKNLYERSS